MFVEGEVFVELSSSVAPSLLHLPPLSSATVPDRGAFESHKNTDGHTPTHLLRRAISLTEHMVGKRSRGY